MKAALNILALLASCIALASCKSKKADDTAETLPVFVHPDLLENQMKGAPTTFLSSAANSKIHWQNWNPAVLEKAAEANRLVFALIGSSRYPGCFESLEALERNPALIRRLNNDFVPVLADIDMTRETSLIAYDLSPETNNPVAFPFLILLSPEGSPVTWQPLQYRDDRTIREFFDNSAEVITRLWDESPGYVKDDSAEKLSLRQERLPPPDPESGDLEERQRIFHACIRRIASFYDEDIASVSGAGGLFPFGVFDTLSLATYDPSLPAPLRQRCNEILNAFSATVLRSAMVDPLDGGVYPSRHGSSWNLPLFRRDCVTQARASTTLARLHQLNNTPDTLRVAIEAIAFAETQFLTPEGLFALTAKASASPDKEWLWTMEQVSNALSEEEYTAWKAHSELNPLGNLPSEADPRRRYFRLNSLGNRIPLEEVSATIGFELNKTKSLIESGRKKLLKARENRFPTPRPDPTPSATASFRMISAYAALYAATGDSQWKNKATALGKASKETFCAARFINERRDGTPDSMSDGRAFTYAVAVQAGIDLGAITLGEEWYLWAQDLSTLLAEHFVTEDGKLVEVRSIAKVIDLNFEDRLMVFDASTAGLVRLNLARLSSIGFKTPPALDPWTKSLPPLERAPIVFTDTLQSMSFEWSHSRLDVGPQTPADLSDQVCTLPLELFERRIQRPEGDTVELTSPDGEKSILSDPASVKALVKAP